MGTPVLVTWAYEGEILEVEAERPEGIEELNQVMNAGEKAKFSSLPDGDYAAFFVSEGTLFVPAEQLVKVENVSDLSTLRRKTE